MTYFLESLHKNLGRLPTFALCIEGAPRSRTTSAANLARIYGARVRTRVSAPADRREALRKYLVDRGLVPKYGSAGAPTIDALLARLIEGEELEVQDFWLSSDTVRSSAGAERESSLVRTVSTCVELGLLTPGKLSLTSWGEVLLTLASLEALLSGQNPFEPSPAYCWAAYFLVLRSDWAFSGAVLRALPEMRFGFREDILPKATSIIESVLRATPASASNRSARAWLTRQLQSARRLDVRSLELQPSDSVDTKTLLRPLEDVFLPRLEFMVDVGILTKPDPGRFTYERGPSYEAFSELVAGSQTRLDHSFFTTVARASGRDGTAVEAPDGVAAHLAQSARALKGVTGYAPIHETVTLANLTGWARDPWMYVEIETAEAALRSLATATPVRARLLSDRFGRAHTFSLLEATGGPR